MEVGDIVCGTPPDSESPVLLGIVKHITPTGRLRIDGIEYELANTEYYCSKTIDPGYEWNVYFHFRPKTPVTPNGLKFYAKLVNGWFVDDKWRASWKKYEDGDNMMDNLFFFEEGSFL